MEVETLSHDDRLDTVADRHLDEPRKSEDPKDRPCAVELDDGDWDGQKSCDNGTDGGDEVEKERQDPEHHCEIESKQTQNDPNQMGYQPRFTAFLDLLGFSKLVENSPQSSSAIVHIHNTLAAMRKAFPQWDDRTRQNEEAYLREIHRLQPAARGFAFGQHDLFRTSMFSDNVAFSGPISPTGFMVLVATAAFVWLDLVRHGVLLRGGMTAGLLHHSETQIFGPALVECHELESRVAKYPRIVLSSKFVKAILDVQGRPDLPDHFALLRCDVDGIYHIHTLAPIMADIVGQSDREAYFQGLRELIAENLGSDPPLDDRVREKWVWLGSYFNETIVAEPQLQLKPVSL